MAVATSKSTVATDSPIQAFIHVAVQNRESGKDPHPRTYSQHATDFCRTSGTKDWQISNFAWHHSLELGADTVGAASGRRRRWVLGLRRLRSFTEVQELNIDSRGEVLESTQLGRPEGF